MPETVRCAAEVPILETERLRLRGHRRDDFAASAAMWADPIVTRYIGGKPLSMRFHPAEQRSSLHADLDLQLAVASNLDSFAAFQERLQHRRISPLQIPTIGQSDDSVLSWHNIRQREGTIAIALVATE